MSSHLVKQLARINQQMKTMDGLYHKIAVSFRMSDSRFWILYALMEGDGKYTQQDLSEMLSLPKQTLNTTVLNLCKAGYVQFLPTANRGKRKMIALTAQGKEYGQQTLLKVMQAEEAAFAQFGEEKAEAFAQLLEEMTALFKTEFSKSVLPAKSAMHEGENSSEG